MDKILEFCGFKRKWVHCDCDMCRNAYDYPDGGFVSAISLDMNFFFKYVVPKLRNYNIEAETEMLMHPKVTLNGMYWVRAADINLAWQEALMKLLEAKGADSS